MTRRGRLPGTVVALGWVSFFTDVSSEMIVPLLPFFLTTVLGGGAISLGFVEGVADATASVLKLVAGAWADKARKYRVFVMSGYGLSAIARPLVAFATAPWHVVLVRAIDRTGKGVRTSPRDVMVAAATPESHRGRAYGFNRAMDNAGATVGPLIAIAILALGTRHLPTVFLIAAIPGTAALAVLAFFVRETPAAAKAAPKISWKADVPDSALLRLLAPLALFTLGNSSDLFILLNVGREGWSPTQMALLWAGLNSVKSAVSWISGPFVDRFGPVKLVVGGWIVYSAVYVGFALATSTAVIVALCLVYGVHHGLTEGAEKTLVAKIAPAQRRGAYFGWYYLVVGLLALPASALFGAIWSARGSATAFLFGASLAALACIALFVLRPDRQAAEARK
jgi:MFS family permease